jgi:hypothetical protein
MSNVIVVIFLALVAIAPMAYLAFMATALKSSDKSEFLISGVK